MYMNYFGTCHAPSLWALEGGDGFVVSFPHTEASRYQGFVGYRLWQMLKKRKGAPLRQEKCVPNYPPSVGYDRHCGILEPAQDDPRCEGSSLQMRTWMTWGRMRLAEEQKNCNWGGLWEPLCWCPPQNWRYWENLLFRPLFERKRN